ncbi:glycosyltransferase family 2 protein [Sphaerulina musiva SO2202]|uniref:Glycosyltransferase family 2 protein n=1 Tax=Sphaerulina musiva (strain SO2202) TaxID=692275 RepID=M3B2I2_SPHMS|nr:glycosyltransferase family 2 protein [Sphaerulina musiva SO2202]EMF13967.1 glycosyltransferase family 2 protein [Sphaerulina musiva SO2202]
MVSWYYVAVFAWYVLFRYIRLIVNCISHWTFKPVPIAENPSYTSQDVTIILPTIATGGDSLRDTISTCLKSEPYELLLVTIDANSEALTKMANEINAKKIRVLSIREANKRRQMCRGIPEVVTRITIFVDDDVVWPEKVLPWMLAPFEDPKTGGVGTSQRLKRPDSMSAFAFLGATYLERRNWDCSACLNIDGGLPCLSGRTVAYRSDILQDEAFTHGFTHEEWRTMQLNADDDNFITRWLYSHDWKIKMQYHKECEVRTTLEDGPKYLSQCLRWVRSNWRSNLTSLFVERHYWYTQPWSTYTVLQTTLTAWALPYDILIFTSWYQASTEWSSDSRWYLFTFLILWTYGFSKTVKLWGHFFRYPADVVYMPLYIAFGYFHGLIKLYGAFTLSETTWGSRDGADTDNRVRMIKLPAYGSSQLDQPDGRKSESFDYPPSGMPPVVDQLPAYATHMEHEPIPLLSTTNVQQHHHHHHHHNNMININNNNNTNHYHD